MKFSVEQTEIIEKAKANIRVTKNKLDGRRPRYLRNINRYLNVRGMRSVNDLDSLSAIVNTWDMYSQTDESLQYFQTFNVSKSVVDTYVSKMSQSRVRPFFGTKGGNFLDRKSARAAQKYFDGYFQKQEIYKKMSMIVRDSAVFDVGVMWIDDDTFNCTRLLPWCVYVDPYEYAMSAHTFAFLDYTYWPREDLKRFGLTEKEYKNYGPEGRPVTIYYDVQNGWKIYFVSGNVTRIERIEYKVIPFEFLFFDNPIKGFFTTAGMDILYPIQVKLDRTEDDTQFAFSRAMKHTIVVDDSVKASKLTSTIAEIVSIPSGKAVVGGGTGIQVLTPPAISDQYLQRIEMLIKHAYEMFGISQMSAQSQKPKGADSGKALETLQNVESERFEPQLREFVDMYNRIADKNCRIFPQDAEVLPQSDSNGIKWSDIVASIDKFSIKFSPADIMSDDPNEKMKAILSLPWVEFADQSTITTLMQQPDLERAYAIMNVNFDYAETILQRTITEGKPRDFFPVIELSMLQRIVQTTLMEMDMQGASDDIKNSLMDLLKLVIQLQKPPAPPVGADAMVGGLAQQNAAPMQMQGAVGNTNVTALPAGAPMQNISPDMGNGGQ